MPSVKSGDLAKRLNAGRPTRINENQMMLALARRQHGVLSRRQLERLAIPAARIDQRVKESRLVPIFTGVYALGHDIISHRGWWQAALLSGGTGAVLSHTSAAACWNLIEPRNRIEIVRTFNRERLSPKHPNGVNRKLLTVHRSRRLEAEELTTHNGFPLTTVARTILNLSATFSLVQLESVISDADKMQILDWDQLRLVSKRGAGWKGIGKLKAIVDAWDPRLTDAKSRMERRFIHLCRENSVPLPAVNVMVEGFEVDCLWRNERLIVELDSRSFHDQLQAFDKDRRRDVRLGNARFVVRRVTYGQLFGDPDYVLCEVLQGLAY